MNERISPYKISAINNCASYFFCHESNRNCQHEGHDMSKMPGMSKPKPKAKTRRKKGSGTKAETRRG